MLDEYASFVSENLNDSKSEYLHKSKQNYKIKSSVKDDNTEFINKSINSNYNQSEKIRKINIKNYDESSSRNIHDKNHIVEKSSYSKLDEITNKSITEKKNSILQHIENSRLNTSNKKPEYQRSKVDKPVNLIEKNKNKDYSKMQNEVSIAYEDAFDKYDEFNNDNNSNLERSNINKTEKSIYQINKKSKENS